MAQRLFALLMLCCLWVTGPVAAETAKATAAPPAATKPQKSPEDRYLDGLACLKQSDSACALVALAGINPASPYAKILDAQIAAKRQDFDTVLRLLIPLQAENSLLPQASASLHATLAQAYENQESPLRALEQRCLAEPLLAEATEVEANQSRIWETLAAQPKEILLEMRGESPNTTVQGWIDLALAIAYAGQHNRPIEQWRSAYPDHPASAALLERLASDTSAPAPAADLPVKIALLLPLETPIYAAAAQALKAGFVAAHAAAQSQSQIQTYPTTGNKDGLASIYQLAVAEGASYIVGPMTREEVNALANSGLVTVPTLALNRPDDDAGIPEKLLLFGQPIEAETQQIASINRRHGMQSALVVAADTPLAKRMAESFVAAWKAQDGSISLEATFSSDSGLTELKAQAAAHPADMIFLAATAEQARLVRPYLDPATPTFGTSHIFDGDALNPFNVALAAVHFVDMPWLINPADPEFAPYRQAATGLPSGEAQRWFAVGVDAWHILAAGVSGAYHPLRGLTGDIRWKNGQPVRELSTARFHPKGIVAESSP